MMASSLEGHLRMAGFLTFLLLGKYELEGERRVVRKVVWILWRWLVHMTFLMSLLPQFFAIIISFLFFTLAYLQARHEIWRKFTQRVRFFCLPKNYSIFTCEQICTLYLLMTRRTCCSFIQSSQRCIVPDYGTEPLTSANRLTLIKDTSNTEAATYMFNPAAVSNGILNRSWSTGCHIRVVSSYILGGHLITTCQGICYSSTTAANHCC